MQRSIASGYGRTECAVEMFWWAARCRAMADVGVRRIPRRRHPFAAQHFRCCAAILVCAATALHATCIRSRAQRLSRSSRRRFRLLQQMLPPPIAAAAVCSLRAWLAPRTVFAELIILATSDAEFRRIDRAETGNGIRRVEVPLVLRRPTKSRIAGSADPGAAKRRTGQIGRHARLQESADVGSGARSIRSAAGWRDRMALSLPFFVLPASGVGAGRPLLGDCPSRVCVAASCASCLRRDQRDRKFSGSLIASSPAADRGAPALPDRRGRACACRTCCST